MQTIQLEVLNAEEEAAKNLAVLAANDVQEFERIVAANLRAGHPLPETGLHLFVSTRSVPRRSRAGITFGRDRLHLIVVANVADPGQVPSGAIPISVRQAHMILNDNELSLSSRSATDADAAALRTTVADRDAEIAALKAENARLAREARQGAEPDANGGPARLRAARAAGKDPEGFGGR